MSKQEYKTLSTLVCQCVFNIIVHAARDVFYAARDRLMVHTNKSKTQRNISWKTFLTEGEFIVCSVH